MTDIVISNIVTALCTGSLSWLFTLRYTRKEAEAGAMEHVQRVYQTLVADLQADRSNLKETINHMNSRITVLERVVRDGAPRMCAFSDDCQKFKRYEMPA